MYTPPPTGRAMSATRWSGWLFWVGVDAEPGASNGEVSVGKTWSTQYPCLTNDWNQAAQTEPVTGSVATEGLTWG